MTLIIRFFRHDDAGDFQTEEIDGAGSELAGVEATRHELWGSDLVRQLGATYLPELDERDLYIEFRDVSAFRKECQFLLRRAEDVSYRTGYEVEYIRFRLNNFIHAADLAAEKSWGIWIG